MTGGIEGFAAGLAGFARVGLLAGATPLEALRMAARLEALVQGDG